MRCALLLLLAVMLSFSESSAQKKQGQARLDSLLAEVQTMREDTNAVKLMSFISQMYYYINPNEGLKWAQKELSLAKKIGWKQGEAFAYNDFGLNYQFQGAYPSALESFFKSLRIDESLGNKRGVGANFGCIGIVYYRQTDYTKALEWNLKSLKIAEEQGDKRSMRDALANIGSVYEQQEKHAEALEYKLKSFHISEELNDQHGVLINAGNISNSYASMRQYNGSLAYDFKALRIAKEVGDKRTIAGKLGDAGEYYYFIAKDETPPKPDSLVPESRAANLVKAIEYLNKGIVASREIGLGENVVEYQDYLAKALALQGDYKSRIKKRNERILSIAGFAVLLLLFGILFYKFRKQKHGQ